MSMAITLFSLGMYYYQNRIRQERKMEEALAEKNRTINILSAEMNVIVLVVICMIPWDTPLP